MPNNRIDYFGKILIDISNTTVKPETLTEGVTAYDKAGNLIRGTVKNGNTMKF